MDQLPRKLGRLDATFIVSGIGIGAGIFLLPNTIARALPSGPAILAVWVAAGVLSYFGALAYAELGAMLLRRLARPGAHVESHTFPCQLLERGSCAPPAEEAQ